MAWKGHPMQQGSIIHAERKGGLDVWEFRWREPGPDGKRKHRRMVIGRIDQLVDESAARGRIAALHLDINFWDARLKGKPSRYQSWRSTIGNGSSSPILFGR